MRLSIGCQELLVAPDTCRVHVLHTLNKKEGGREGEREVEIERGNQSNRLAKIERERER